MLTQHGTMTGGDATLDYRVAPGSGSGEMTGLTGTVVLDVDEDGTHHLRLEP